MTHQMVCILLVLYIQLVENFSKILLTSSKRQLIILVEQFEHEVALTNLLKRLVLFIEIGQVVGLMKGQVIGAKIGILVASF